MPHPVQTHFELAGDPDWQVRDLVFREALSHPYTKDGFSGNSLFKPKRAFGHS